MRVFKNKWFVRFARKENIDDEQLCAAINRAEEGLVDADLGGGLIKQRISRVGEGRSGGYRTIIAYRSGDRAVFIYGFAKNEQDNVDRQDLKLLKKAASVYLRLGLAELQKLMDGGTLSEVFN